MYVHEEIMEALGKIQRKYGMEKTEAVAETAQAIHLMLTLNEPDIGAMLDAILERKPRRIRPFDIMEAA